MTKLLRRTAVGCIVTVSIALAASAASAQSSPQAESVAAAEDAKQQTTATGDPAKSPAESVEDMIEKIAASGRIQQIGLTSSARLQPALPLAPGTPPILAFRYIDGQARHRFGNLDLVMDDAGH